ncbi:MAG: hypothetical protein E6G22_00605 [Actinobacteria bacterium]|nr:MAG: hypothetical protein E6G22_00605 [Actinomycetota bacterium]
MARFAVVAAVVAAAVALAAPAHAAAPNYILVSGPGLEQPILLDDWAENLELLVAVGNSPRAKRPALRGLARRPRFDLAEFWAWSANPAPTDPSQANQHGSFYPAHGHRPALFKMMVDGTRVPRIASARALAILARHGVPTRR